MRLKSIKLAGFKSFVDPVTVPFSGNMTAIVGPNGCGKSNIIDAVRWVMGESSAKTLRGESMTDVIFNGSTGRKPVGQASIELVFDNREGRMGGPYAQYAEIAVKRLVTRDSQSSYFFNGQKCRRRDIADLFLGTGLGPRSYALIGQGMISRLIEARPEELRATLEEAAGISKYKERRRETANRMRRTQENLERLDDIREELDKQLERLKRQAEAARRYQTLKNEEHRLKGELAVLRGRALRAQQHEQEQGVQVLETRVEREVLGARQCETRLEEARLEHDRLAETLDGHQARFYETGAAIARLEQQLEHARGQEQRLARELDAARRELDELERVGSDDAKRLAHLDERLEELKPEQEAVAETLAELEATLEEAEQALEEAQSQWETFSERDREASREAERAQDAVRQFERQLQSLETDSRRRRQQRDELPDQRELRARRDALGEQLAELDLRFETLAEHRARLQAERDESREASQDVETRREEERQQRSRLQGELASLDALIAAGRDDDQGDLQHWLERHGLAEAPRLAERLQVEPGWEDVVAWVLSPWLNARVLAELPNAALEPALGSTELALLTEDSLASPPGTLAARVSGAGSVTTVLGAIYCAADPAVAWTQSARLAPGESVITADGLWLGPGWARRRADGDSGDSLLGQQRRRQEVNDELETLVKALTAQDQRLNELQEQAVTIEAALERCRQEEQEHQHQQQQLALQKAGLDSRLEHVDARAGELDEELETLGARHEQDVMALDQARERWQNAMTVLENSSEQREALGRRRRDAQETVTGLRARRQPQEQQAHQLALEYQRLTTERAGLDQQRQRSAEGHERLTERCAELEAQQEALREPEEESRERLDELLHRRGREEQALNACRDEAQRLADSLRETEATRQRHERDLESVRADLEEGRMQVQALALKADAQDEVLAELALDGPTLDAALDAEATESAWQKRLEGVADKVRRLGAINLAAIEEYDQQLERRNYLEAQHDELSEALATLDKAIRKIDQETRTRFKATFDEINGGIAELFPRVFGGGTAWLTLTGEDLLETGVAIMARPPGKKNSTIHLLSGGEKALTALSLVFAIFQLNPAPFCMLDEVDAPLDDANVGRYAALVKDMAESVQFIYITHNKIAMEASERLMGVTMQEPGVSRLVSVGVEEAVALAEA